MSEPFDLVVIGAGPAGEKAASQAAYFGKSVAVVEREADPGGAAVSTSGIPNKTLRETALYLSGFRKRDIYGLSLGLGPEMTLDRLMARTSTVVDTMTESVRRNLDRPNITLIRGEGSLGPDRTVLVHTNGTTRRLSAAVILVATGSRPLRPPGVSFDDPDVHDSETILQVDRIPRALVVIGGGPAGCEYASIFTALGVQVTLIDLAPRVVPFMDEEMSELLAETFRGMGMRVILGTVEPATIGRSAGHLEVRLAEGEVLHPDTVLFAAGRVGNTEGLGLAEVGMAVDERGRIVVDGDFQTSAEGIYAAGDVIGPPALSSVSQEQGRAAICHAFGIPFKQVLDSVPPYGVYAIPEMAMVGMTERAAGDAGIDYEVGRGRFERNARAIIAGSTEGMVKLVFRRQSRELLGVHILGEIAAELIHIGQAALHDEATIDRFIDTTFNVPTFSEAYKYAAYDGLQRLAAAPQA